MLETDTLNGFCNLCFFPLAAPFKESVRLERAIHKILAGLGFSPKETA